MRGGGRVKNFRRKVFAGGHRILKGNNYCTIPVIGARAGVPLGGGGGGARPPPPPPKKKRKKERKKNKEKMNVSERKIDAIREEINRTNLNLLFQK